MSNAIFTDWILKKPIIAEYLAATKELPDTTPKAKQPTYDIKNIPSIVTETINQEIQDTVANTVDEKIQDTIANTNDEEIQDTIGQEIQDTINEEIQGTIDEETQISNRRKDHLIECTANILRQKHYGTKLYPFLCQEVEAQQLPGLVALGMDVNEMFDQVCVQGKHELFSPLVHLGAVPSLKHFGLTNSISIFNELICIVPVDTTNEVIDSGCNVMEKWIEKGPKLPLYAVDFGFKGNQRCLERAIHFEDNQLVAALLQQGVPINEKIQVLAYMSNDRIKNMVTMPTSWSY